MIRQKSNIPVTSSTPHRIEVPLPRLSKGLLSLALATLLLIPLASNAQRAAALDYEPSPAHPFGRPHPDAPKELGQFAFMIGQNDCTEERLNNTTQEWVAGERTWDAHYFMNGHGIRDSGRSGSTTNGNIRLFDTLTKTWNVTFFSSPVYGSSTWQGKKVGDEIILKIPQKAPGTDFDGFSTLTFSNISETGFDWRGEWISVDESVVFPYWRISCVKRQSP